MSIRHIQRVFDHSETTGSARTALIVLADKMDDVGYCWPGQELIARQAGLSTRTIIRALAQAEEKAEILILPRPGRSNAYIMTLQADRDTVLEALVERARMTKREAQATLIEYEERHRTPDRLSPPQDPDPCQLVTTPLTGCHMTPDRLTPDPLVTISTQEEEEKDRSFWTSPRKPLTRKAGRQYAAEIGTTDPSAILVAHMQTLIEQPKGLIKKYKEAAGISVLGESDRATITAWIDYYQAKVDAHEMDRNLASRLAYAAIRDGNPAPVAPEPVTVASISQPQPINAWASFMAAD